MFKSTKLLIMLVSVVVFVACNPEEDGNMQPPVSKRVETLLDIIDVENGKPLQEVTVGTPVRLVLEVKNLTNETLTLNFSTNQHYEFEIHNAENQLVWKWSQGHFFLQVLTEIILAPKEQIKFTPEWDQKDGEGRQVPAGIYKVTGLIPTRGPEFVESQSKSLTIKE